MPTDWTAHTLHRSRIITGISGPLVIMWYTMEEVKPVAGGSKNLVVVLCGEPLRL